MGRFPPLGISLPGVYVHGGNVASVCTGSPQANGHDIRKELAACVFPSLLVGSVRGHSLFSERPPLSCGSYRDPDSDRRIVLAGVSDFATPAPMAASGRGHSNGVELGNILPFSRTNGSVRPDEQYWNQN